MLNRREPIAADPCIAAGFTVGRLPALSHISWRRVADLLASSSGFLDFRSSASAA